MGLQWHVEVLAMQVYRQRGGGIGKIAGSDDVGRS